MRYEPETQVVLPSVTVELATITWSEASASPLRETHALFQRLSRDHPPLRLGELSAYDLLPRMRSVGFVPAGTSVPLAPVGKPLKVLTCFFDAAYAESRTGMATEFWARHRVALASLRNKRLELLMQELHAELEQPGPAHEFLIGALSDVMLVEVGRFALRQERRKTKQGIVLALAPWQLLKVEERINISPELGRYPSLSELAELCGISVGHLTRAFKVSTGWQIHKYISAQRIRTAHDLLCEGDLTCEQVAARLGFSSPGYFATAFRRMTGEAPSEVRRKSIAARV